MTDAALFDLDAFCQGWIAAASGLGGALVRPRQQDLPPADPGPAVTWIALEPLRIGADPYPVLCHHGENGGWSEMIAHDRIDLSCRVIGPQAEAVALTLRDQVLSPLHRAALFRVRMGLDEVSVAEAAPESLAQNQRRRRAFDLTATLHRETRRPLDIPSLTSAPIHFIRRTSP